MDPRKCVILVPFSAFIHQECDDALKELERRGYPVRRVGGYAAIDQGRNQMATDALLDGFEETLWIDADIGFHPDGVDQLRSHELAIVGGIYPQKGGAEAGSGLICFVEHTYDYLNRWVTQKKTQKKTGQVPYWQSGQVRLRVSPR